MRPVSSMHYSDVDPLTQWEPRIQRLDESDLK